MRLGRQVKDRIRFGVFNKLADFPDGTNIHVLESMFWRLLDVIDGSSAARVT